MFYFWGVVLERVTLLSGKCGTVELQW